MKIPWFFSGSARFPREPQPEARTLGLRSLPRLGRVFEARETQRFSEFETRNLGPALAITNDHHWGREMFRSHKNGDDLGWFIIEFT